MLLSCALCWDLEDWLVVDVIADLYLGFGRIGGVVV